MAGNMWLHRQHIACFLKIIAYMDMGVSMEEIAGKLQVTLGEVKQIAAEIVTS